MSDEASPRTALFHGAEIPQIGLGTWPMSNEEAERSVTQAIELGYRLIDTAQNYRNEAGVGRGLRASGVSRDELFVTSKLNADWHGIEEVQEAFATSVSLLGLEYLDLFLIHWPVPKRNRYVDAWRGLLRLLEEGKVRAIGLSNFKRSHIERLMQEVGEVADLNQVQLNPTVTRSEIRAFDAALGIVTQSWSPIGKGGDLLVEPVITELGARYGKTSAQIVLRWHLELGLIAIPKSSDPRRMAENIDVFDFSLAPDEVAAISALDRGEQAALDSDVVGH